MSVPIVNIVGPNDQTTVGRSGGRHVTMVNAGNAVGDSICGRAVGSGSGNVSIVDVDYPGFIPLIRDGRCGKSVTGGIITRALGPLLGRSISALVLKYARCPLLAPLVRGIVNPYMALVSSKTRAMSRIDALLSCFQLTRDSRGGRTSRCQFCAANSPGLFSSVTRG